MNERITNVMDALKKRKIACSYYGNRKEAAVRLLEMIPENSVIGIGGSVTVQELNIQNALQEKGCQVYWHWLVKEEEMDSVRHRAMSADIYLCSTNAVTENGLLVNIDGIGNRVAAMIFGPPKVFIVAGKNKIAKDLVGALRRIKDTACPQNGRRLHKNTPCANTGKCNDCKSEDRMCNITTIIEGNPKSLALHVLIVGEDMGF
ncbi:MAG: lactate utilization protein [Firmicutes bacterium]|nr:lactate utilization protein [Bacillota bacterium]MCL5993655.1 lactate utilization protein [Bacillota bacterium]